MSNPVLVIERVREAIEAWDGGATTEQLVLAMRNALRWLERDPEGRIPYTAAEVRHEQLVIADAALQQIAKTLGQAFEVTRTKDQRRRDVETARKIALATLRELGPENSPEIQGGLAGVTAGADSGRELEGARELLRGATSEASAVYVTMPMRTAKEILAILDRLGSRRAADHDTSANSA